jgi:hypothetical protein
MKGGPVSRAEESLASARGMLMAFQAYMERGLLSQADFDELQRVYSHQSFSYIMQSIFAAWGKRAS